MASPSILPTHASTSYSSHPPQQPPQHHASDRQPSLESPFNTPQWQTYGCSSDDWPNHHQHRRSRLSSSYTPPCSDSSAPPSQPAPVARRHDSANFTVAAGYGGPIQDTLHHHTLSSSSCRWPKEPVYLSSQDGRNPSSHVASPEPAHLDGRPKVFPTVDPRANDIEKQDHSPIITDWASAQHSRYTYSSDDDDLDEKAQPSSPLKPLLHICLCAPILSLTLAIYTLIVLILTAIVAPLRLCMPSRLSFRDHATSLLAPAIRLQLRCVNASIQSTLPETTNQASPTLPAPLASRLGSVVCTHLLAPLAIFPLTAWAWVVAIFWFFSSIVNDEASVDGDGKRMSTNLIDWWIWYLEGRAFR